MSKSFQCFIVTQHEVSTTDGKGAGVGLATFSVRLFKQDSNKNQTTYLFQPLKPTPTCSLMKDYYTWQSKTKSMYAFFLQKIVHIIKSEYEIKW